jgi:hypothetical protein
MLSGDFAVGRKSFWSGLCGPNVIAVEGNVLPRYRLACVLEQILRCLHLDSDAVERLSRGVEDPSGWLRRHVYDQTSLTIPGLDRLYDIPVWRQLRTVRSKIMHWPLDLVEHENGRPPMMVDGFFVVWLQSYFKHPKALALEEDFVMFWRCDHGVQCRIPSRWM